MTWNIITFNEPVKQGVLISGLPGIGNVGKIVTDFLIEELKAQKVCEFHSHYMPQAVFVQEDNMVSLPKISMFQHQNLLILTGDSQPIDEHGTYSFCETLLDFLQQNQCNEIVTLGGIGLSDLPKTPKVYCTGNNNALVERYVKDTKMSGKIFGVVGPIMGVSGLLVGLAGMRSIPAVSILAETLGHPMYLGLKGAREILKVLNQKFSLNIDLKNLEKEIADIESRIKISDKLKKPKKNEDVSYIG